MLSIRFKARIFGLLLLCLPATCLYAQTVEQVKQSMDYYWGEGTGKTTSLANEEALSMLTGNISVNVESSFIERMEEMWKNNKSDFTRYVESIVKTYSNVTIKNTEILSWGEEPEIHVLRFVKKTETYKIFTEREHKIKEFVEIAGRAESKYQMSEALRYYYWALMLLQSHPDKITMEIDGKKQKLDVYLPAQINAVFDLLDFSVIGKQLDDNITQYLLKITYKKEPIVNCDYSFFDGRNWSVVISAQNGKGRAEMAGDAALHKGIQIRIEYAFENEWKIDNEVNDVLRKVERTRFPKHERNVSLTETTPDSGNAQDNNNLTVENFAKDEKDSVHITNSRKDKNGKVCAIVKIETPLSLRNMTFDARTTSVERSEQKNGAIWLWMSPGSQRLTIMHEYLGTLSNYPFGEALKEATVYIMKLKSGRDPAQYMEMICAIEGATVKIDDEAAELFTGGKFHKQLSYGKHRYTVEAPMYYPEIGVTEITGQKSDPISVSLKPKFGKITVNTEPEQGADVFIDDEKKGQSPLTIERIGSGNHKIHAMKLMFLTATQEIVVTEGATASHTLTLQPNFAVVTLTTLDGGDIYIDNEKRAYTQWNGRLTQGQYKVEVQKPSHRPSTTAIEVRAGIDTTISLKAPTPIYGSLDITTDNGIKAAIFVDGKEQGTTPAIIGSLLIGSHDITLKAEGYQPATKKVEVTEGKIEEVKISMQETEKFGSLRITSNPSTSVSVNGKSAGDTPVTVNNLSLGKTTVHFDSKYSYNNDSYYYFKPLTKTVNIVAGYNELYGELKKKKIADPVWIFNYRLSPPTSYVGASVGYCKRFGGYVQFRTDILSPNGGGFLAEKDLTMIDENFSGGDRKYFRTSYTAGGMLRLFSFVYVYGGAGYGKYGAVYKDIDNVYYTSGLIKGIELEYGANFKIWKNLSIAAGYSTIAGSDFGELHFGMGIIIK